MADPQLFWTIFAAVLSAIILGGTFFWGLIAYNRHERDGTAGSTPSNVKLIAVLMPLVFLAAGFYISGGGT